MNRRTIRKYKDEKVDDEIIEKIIRAGLTSPSGRNIKPWEIIVVKERELLSKLGGVRGGISGHMANAAFGIVIIADPSLTDIWIEDASIMTTIIQLAAESFGLGSCWIHARERFNSENKSVEDLIKEILNIPEIYRVESMLAIGYPDEKKEPYNEENLDYHKVHYNKFKL